MWQRLLPLLPVLLRAVRAILLPAAAGVAVGVSLPSDAPAPQGEITWLEHPSLIALESRLRAELPPDKPVLVALAPLDVHGLQGLAEDRGNFFLVLLDEGLDPQYQAEVLLHEWAHLLSWGDGHGPLWAQAYGIVFRAWVGE